MCDDQNDDQKVVPLPEVVKCEENRDCEGRDPHDVNYIESYVFCPMKCLNCNKTFTKENEIIIRIKEGKLKRRCPTCNKILYLK
jgi:hypothetical protein